MDVSIEGSGSRRTTAPADGRSAVGPRRHRRDGRGRALGPAGVEEHRVLAVAQVERDVTHVRHEDRPSAAQMLHQAGGEGKGFRSRVAPGEDQAVGAGQVLAKRRVAQGAQEADAAREPRRPAQRRRKRSPRSVPS